MNGSIVNNIALSFSLLTAALRPAPAQRELAGTPSTSVVGTSITTMVIIAISLMFCNHIIALRAYARLRHFTTRQASEGYGGSTVARFW